MRFRAGERRARTGVDAVPEAEVLARVRPVEAELVGVVELPGSRFAAPLSTYTVVPGAISTPPTLALTLASLNEPFNGVSCRSTSSMNGAISSGSARSAAWTSGRSPRIWNELVIEARRGLAAGREQVGRNPHHVVNRRQRAVGERCVGHLGHHIALRIRAAIGDVTRELRVEKLERLVLKRVGPLFAAPAASGTRHDLRRVRRASRRRPSPCTESCTPG